MSEKPTTRSGWSATIFATFPPVKPLTIGARSRASGGRQVHALIPTIRWPSPRRCRISVGSSVRQTMRRGASTAVRYADPRRTPLLRPRVGVSACLLGQEVRHDGGHKRSAFVVEEL